MAPLPERLKAVRDRDRRLPPGLGPPGLNPLFLAVVVAAVCGVAAGIGADGKAELVDSNLVYRMAIGAMVLAILYAVIAIAWLAWHRRVLKKLNVGAVGGETPDQATATEITSRDDEINEFMETTTKAIAELYERTKP